MYVNRQIICAKAAGNRICKRKILRRFFFCGRSHRMIMVWECKRMHIAGAFHKSHSKARLTAVLGNERQRAMNER
ncbi:hypothetical protein DWY22_12035 [Heyndrickxia coagulans]|nr:hypothetical protein DWY22_12035 [Heyndrickxia coagulans]RGR95770.1 hypothetical protein DWY16_12525 [Heyndrickxia coagulans]